MSENAFVSLCIDASCLGVDEHVDKREGYGKVGAGAVEGGCIWALGSRLISFSHPQTSPSSLGVSINNQSP